MTDPRDRPDVASLTYEQSRDELIQVVTSLEHGTASLEDSLALWERGEALADRCQGWLDAAKERLAAASADRSQAQTGDDDRAGIDNPAGDSRTSDNKASDSTVGDSGSTGHRSAAGAAGPDTAQPSGDDGPPW